MSENECGWIEIFIETEKEGFEPVSGIIYQCGVTGVMIEDSDDFTDFLENPARDWDYIGRAGGKEKGFQRRHNFLCTR